ncbi:hypothetical protein KJ815_12975, partial [bacterium]|nr:hypothetical protein [bacterium]
MSEFNPQSPRPEQSPFRTPKQYAVYERILRLLGDTVATYWRDACDIANNHDFRTKCNLVFHLLREIDGYIRELAYPVSDKSKKDDDTECQRADHEASIDEVAKVLGLYNDPVIKEWKKVREFYKYAHRASLQTIRSFDEGSWNTYERVIEVLLHRIESRYSDFEKTIDLLVNKKHPTAADLTILG